MVGETKCVAKSSLRGPRCEDRVGLEVQRAPPFVPLLISSLGVLHSFGGQKSVGFRCSRLGGASFVDRIDI